MKQVQLEGIRYKRLMELGLGRGVDIADPTPWKHKAIYQVRTVTGENTIETVEGGGERRFDRGVRNASETHWKFNAFIKDPSAALSFGVEGEYSHSTSSLYRIVGTKVLNSTITFKPDGPDGDDQIDDKTHMITYMIHMMMKQLIENLGALPYMMAIDAIDAIDCMELAG